MAENDMNLGDIAVIVVHHRSYDTVPTTVRSILAQGLATECVAVIDNSEEPALRGRLAGSLPAGVEISYVANRGYGAGVNFGLDVLRRRGDNAPYVLVTSHESRPDGGALAKLRKALEDDPSAAVAGPTLVTGQGADVRTWSEGGYLAPFTHRPKHHGFEEALNVRTGRRPVIRQWLDGAFLLYRRADLETFRFSEDYFLYMEETDLHLRLGRAGRSLLWVPDAVAWQSSKGVPAYYFARNLRLFYARNDRGWRGRYVARALVLRRLVGAVVRGRAATEAAALLTGSFVRLPSTSQSSKSDPTVVVNPLGAALRHYQTEILTVIGNRDSRVMALATPEPSASESGRLSWLVRYLVLLTRAAAVTRRGSRGQVLVVWPVLGYVDLILLRATAGSRGSLVLHDPVPLVKAIGYGRLARWIGTRLGASVRVIVHSEAARRALDSRIAAEQVSVLPHPTLPPRRRSTDIENASKHVIRVLGQYKPDRDVAGLSVVAEHFGGSSVLEVHGRGWPDIKGWSVRPQFVSENEMDSLIASSDVVLIPYVRFFQSGIAIRCLEHGTPVVGPAGSSLEDLYGSESPLLVQGADDWARAVAHAIAGGREEAVSAGGRWWTGASAAWQEWRTPTDDCDRRTARWTLLAMGRDELDRDAAWLKMGNVCRIIRLRTATPSGRRLGSRAAGLGVDSMLLAVKALIIARPGPFLAANPWTAVALRVFGARHIAATGLYAMPGSLSYRLLLNLLRTVPIVTLSAIEAEHWSQSGGRATSVLYGNSYGYPTRQPVAESATRIFIGGTSDRDAALIASIEDEARSIGVAVRLTVVDGSPPDRWSEGSSEIRHTGYVPAETFGRLVADSDIVVLPLKDSGRSAGYMVLVGALEAGVPVLTTPVQGIKEYIDGRWVRALDLDAPLLPQIIGHAAERSADSERIRRHWNRNFSLPAYVERVSAALTEMSE